MIGRITQWPPRLSKRTLLAAIASTAPALNQKNIRTRYCGQKFSTTHCTNPPFRRVSSRRCMTYEAKNAQKSAFRNGIAVLHRCKDQLRRFLTLFSDLQHEEHWICR